MVMRKLVMLAAGAALAIVLVLPATASAATVQQQIAALQAAVVSLQAQVRRKCNAATRRRARS